MKFDEIKKILCTDCKSLLIGSRKCECVNFFLDICFPAHLIIEVQHKQMRKDTKGSAGEKK